MATDALALEEDDIVALSLRPGVVDTAMQERIREEGAAVMSEQGHQRFIDLHETGKLLDPSVPAAAIATLVLSAPASLSGSFVSWDDDEVQALQ